MKPNDLLPVLEAEFERRTAEYRETGSPYLDGYADALDWVMQMLAGLEPAE